MDERSAFVIMAVWNLQVQGQYSVPFLRVLYIDTASTEASLDTLSIKVAGIICW